MTTCKEFAADTIASINAFEAQCERDEKTDVGDVWELLDAIRRNAHLALQQRRA